MSNFLASVRGCNVCLNIHVMVNWQLSKQGISWLEQMTVSPVQLPIHRGHVFFKFSADQLLAFNWSQVQVYVFQSYGFPLKLGKD